MHAINIINTLLNEANHLLTPELVQCHRTYGATGRPIRATSVFRIGHQTTGRGRVVVEQWMLVNARTNTATFVTTRNGRTGWDFNPAANTYALDFSKCPRAIHECTPVPIEDCPVTAREPLFTSLSS